MSLRSNRKLLSNDVLAVVFEAGHESVRPDILKKDGAAKSAFERTVSSVNRQWREVALGSPRLWRFINVNHTHQHEKISSYLDRSKACDIHIHCEVYQDSAEMRSNFALVISHAHRWHSLSIESDSYPILYSITSSLQHASVPVLQYLRIYVTHDYEDSGEPTNFFTGGAPNLTSVELYNIMPRHFHVPSRTITSLRLTDCVDAQVQTALHGSIDNAELKRIASELPLLETLSITGNYFGLSSNDFVDLLPSLRSLSLVDGGAIHVLNVCTLAAFPTLEYLVVDWEDHNIRQQWTGEFQIFFDNFKTSSTPSRMCNALQSLMLLAAFPPEFTPIEYLNFIHSFPELTHFGSSENTTALFNVLMTPNDSGSIPWPSLHTLTLCDFDIDTLCTLLSKRENSGSPIRTVFFLPDVSLPEDKEKWLRERVNVEFMQLLRKRPEWGRSPKDYIASRGFWEPFYDYD